MMMNEFTDRTGYEPTPEEYEEIELDYISFDGGKDEFCKAWLGLYGWKVKRQKKERDVAARMAEAPWTFKKVEHDEGENDNYGEKLFAARIGLRIIAYKEIGSNGFVVDYFDELPVVRAARERINEADREAISACPYGDEGMFVTASTEDARTSLILALLDMAAA